MYRWHAARLQVQPLVRNTRAWRPEIGREIRRAFAVIERRVDHDAALAQRGFQRAGAQHIAEVGRYRGLSNVESHGFVAVSGDASQASHICRSEAAANQDGSSIVSSVTTGRYAMAG